MHYLVEGAPAVQVTAPQGAVSPKRVLYTNRRVGWALGLQKCLSGKRSGKVVGIWYHEQKIVNRIVSRIYLLKRQADDANI